MTGLSIYSTIRSVFLAIFPAALFIVSFLVIPGWLRLFWDFREWSFIFFPFLVVISTAFLGEEKARLRGHFIGALIVLILLFSFIMVYVHTAERQGEYITMTPLASFILFVGTFGGYIYLGVYGYRLRREREDFDYHLRAGMWFIGILVLTFSFCTLFLIANFTMLVGIFSYGLILIYPLAISLVTIAIWCTDYILASIFVVLLFLFPLTILAVIGTVCAGGTMLTLSTLLG